MKKIINKKADELLYASQLTVKIQSEVLRERVENTLFWYIKAAKCSKVLFNLSNMISIISGSVIPIINILKIDDQIKIILSSVIAGIGGLALAICRLLNWKETWYDSRASAENIKKECFNFVNKTGDYCGSEEERMKEFVSKLDAIAVEANKQYVIIKDNDKNNNESNNENKDKNNNESNNENKDKNNNENKDKNNNESKDKNNNESNEENNVKNDNKKN